MTASPETTLKPTSPAPVSEIPAAKRIPAWEQIPAGKRQELTQVLADMLLKQVQAVAVGHERAA
jgi:hypothetical protein